MKKTIVVVLAVIMSFSVLSIVPFNAAESSSEVSDGSTISFDTEPALYVHGVLNSADTEGWQAWQSEHDEDYNEIDSSIKYFFLPTSADSSKADIYNAFSTTVTVNGVSIGAGETATVNYDTDTEYTVSADDQSYTLRFMKSDAEAGIYINNGDADGKGTALMKYLMSDKSNSASATGAIIDSEGNIDNTSVKKIKGRGNTSWGSAKKSFNITYSDKVEIAGMNASKKFSIIANYQDDSLSRNRFLYDLADAVDIPYSSDSRYVDFYVNGFYWGSYLICEKVEVGKNNLINDIDDDAYLNEDGTINEDFPFVCEIDASAADDDYYITCSGGNKVTIKSPEIDEGEPGYEEVKEYVKTKFNAFYDAVRDRSSDLSEIADIDSITKLFLINEVGKNWDSGVSSTFFVYKQDVNGNYKFYGSPVWDYDNSLGNAAGLWSELQNMGVDDYTEYTGWWCRYKGKSSSKKSSTNVMNNIAKHSQVLEAAPTIWFEKFVPALSDFFGETSNGIMQSYESYYNTLYGSAEMNYQSGWLLYTGSWVADHTKLSTAAFDSETGKMVLTGSKTYSQSDFTDMFNYAVDWFKGRAAWISEQYYSEYEAGKVLIGDVNKDGTITILDVTEIQKYLANIVTLDDEQMLAADTNGDDGISILDATQIQKYLADIIDTLG